MNSNRLNHSFSVEFADHYGIECALVIHHLQYWIEHNQALGRNFIEGRTWMYQTQKEIAAHFTYMSEDSVYRILKKLEDHEVIIKGNFNKSKFDKTTWYAFKNEEIFTKPRNRKIGPKESQNQNHDPTEPIPYNKANNIPEKQQQEPVPKQKFSPPPDAAAALSKESNFSSSEEQDKIQEHIDNIVEMAKIMGIKISRSIAKNLIENYKFEDVRDTFLEFKSRFVKAQRKIPNNVAGWLFSCLKGRYWVKSTT